MLCPHIVLVPLPQQERLLVTATTNTQSHLLFSLLSPPRKQGSPPQDAASPDVASDRKCLPGCRRHKRSIRRMGPRALATGSP